MKLQSNPVRSRVCAQLVAEVAGRITTRDRYLCQVLWEHRVLTTNQIIDLAFDSLSAAEQRLLTLHRLRVLDRFRPLRTVGSAPFHYILDELGAVMVAAERGVDLAELGYRRDKTLAIAYSQRLGHLVGVNGFFAALVAAARRSAGQAELLRWWSERRCGDTWGQIVRPDGYGRWRESSHTVDFLLEYDRGTEPLARLVDKLHGYRELAAASGIPTPTLFWLPGPRREAALRKLITRPGVPVATAHPLAGDSPAGPVWLPAGPEHTRRHRLAALATQTHTDQ